MADVTIIGGGFSASIAKLLIKSPCKVVTPKNSSCLQMPRRKFLEVNKSFSVIAQSLGTLKFELIKTKLHDRLLLGGNSRVWGGFVNFVYLPKEILEKFQAKNIAVKTLTFEETGSASNNPDLGQMQHESGAIYDASIFLDGSDDGYLERFFLDGDRIGLNLNYMGSKRTAFAEKLILCVGAVQLLDLLYRSGYLSNGDNVVMTEFSYKLKPKFTFSSKSFSEGSTIIRFHLARAICHFLGIQKKPSFLKFFKWVPFYLEQHFSNKSMKCVLELNAGVISEACMNPNDLKFGESIHYCNMQINGEGLNEFVARISPNIIGLGMPFVDQAEPGPISNDIINDAIFKLKHL